MVARSLGLGSRYRPNVRTTLVAHDAADLKIDEELLEFLEADLLPEAAHPLFKRQLREYLRGILEAEGRLKASPVRQRDRDGD